MQRKLKYFGHKQHNCLQRIKLGRQIEEDIKKKIGERCPEYDTVIHRTTEGLQNT
jgi:ethanolamine ammonia-lyase small subunit